jgi:hypothetical protein
MGFLQLNGSVFQYSTPSLGLEKELLYDNHNDVYRVALQFNPQCIESFQDLLNEIDKRVDNNFINRVQFFENGNELILIMAYITKKVYPFGIFIDFESDAIDATFKEKDDTSRITNNGKGKKTNRKRNITNKSTRV